jgi:omega-6 fatty acid desaturase (delta-12 desaturase)
MLEGKELLLATRKFAEEDRKKSWFYALSTFFLLIAAFIGALYPFHILIRISCSILEALLFTRMFVINHDYLHHAILKKSSLANLFFTIYGLFVLTPKSIWKRSHDYHHKHNSKLFTASIGSFPIVTKEKYLTLSTYERLNYLFIRHPLTIALGYIFAFNWGMVILSLFRSPSKHWDSAISLVVHYGVIAIIWINLGFMASFLSVILPLIIGHALGSYLFYVQHNFPGTEFESKEGWTYIGAAMNSTSFLKMSRIMHWFTGNIGYHHIHHANSKIPFYRLPEAFNAMPEFQNPKTSTLHPKDIYKALILKVWDPELKRMLTMKEIKAS